MALSIVGAPAAPIARPRVLVIASGFAAAATGTYFMGLIGVYLTLRSVAVRDLLAWMPPDAKIPLTQPNIMMFTLIMSVVTMQWAVWAVKRDDRHNTYLALLVTLVLGFAFVNMAAYLYSVMGLDIAASKVAVLIYAITGSHVLMVVAAMAFIVLMGFRALGGQFTSRQHDGISAAALFWHANVAVFFVIYLVIYIFK